LESKGSFATLTLHAKSLMVVEPAETTTLLDNFDLSLKATRWLSLPKPNLKRVSASSTTRDLFARRKKVGEKWRLRRHFSPCKKLEGG
jgi:hypothetical protein